MTQGENERTIPLYQKRIDIEKIEAVTGCLRVSTHVEEHTRATVEHAESAPATGN